MPLPSSSQRLVVGYRDDDPRRFGLPGVMGGEKAGKCIDCTHEVYMDRGAINTVRDRDTLVACMFCNDRLRYVERIHQSGLIAQL